MQSRPRKTGLKCATRDSAGTAKGSTSGAFKHSSNKRESDAAPLLGPPSPPANFAGYRGEKRPPPSRSSRDPAGGGVSCGSPLNSQRIAALGQAAVKGDAVAQEDVDLVQLDALLLKVLLGLA